MPGSPSAGAPHQEPGTMRSRVLLMALFAAGFLLFFCPQQQLLLAAAPAPAAAPAGPHLRWQLEESRLPSHAHFALSADGRFFAMGRGWPAEKGDDDHVRVWDLSTGKLAHVLRGQVKE